MPLVCMDEAHNETNEENLELVGSFQMKEVGIVFRVKALRGLRGLRERLLEKIC